jgi:acetyl esterase/lipase
LEGFALHIIIALTLLTAATLSAQPNIVEGFVWASPNGQDLKADLYLPGGAGPFPVVVFLHGGGWTSGDRKQLRRQAADMVQKGVAGFAVDYRLAPQDKYPAAFEDAQAAVKWVRDNAAKYHFDTTRIAAAGSSAGGHLACLLGTSGQGAARVNAVVAFNPVLDLSDATMNDASVVKFLGGTCAEQAKKCREASPLLNVHPHLPPFLILHGTADQSVPYTQATHMVAALKKAGNAVEFFSADGGAHTFWSTEKWYAPSEKAMEIFLLTTFHK